MKIGVVMPIAEDSEQGGTKRYAEIRELALHAEARGLDSIWVFDHLLFRFPDQPTGGIWEAWTMLTGLAEATSRVELGSIVLCMPFRNPALLAKMADTLDEISDGRLILGVGAGWHKPEFDAFGYPFDHRVGRFEEALQVMVPLVREGRVNFEGRYHQALDSELRPRGPRTSGPPILVASARPRMHELTAHYADAWNTAWLGSDTSPLDERLAKLHAACEKVGRDPKTVEITVGLSVAYRAPGENPETGEEPGKVITGTPEEVAQALLAYERKGVGHVICSLDPPSSDAIGWLAEAVRLLREENEQKS